MGIDGALLEGTAQRSIFRTSGRGDGNDLRHSRIGNRADPAGSCRRRVALWLGWGGVVRFCFGVSRFGEQLDSART